MHDHAHVDERRCEQIGNRHGVEGHGDAFADAVRSHQLVADFAPRCQDPAPYLVAEVGGEQAGVERREGLALGVEDVPEFETQGLDVGRPVSLRCRLVTVGIDFDEDLRAGLGGDGEDMLRVHYAVRSRPQRVQQLLLFAHREQVFLVEHDDYGTTAPEERLQRLRNP